MVVLFPLSAVAVPGHLRLTAWPTSWDGREQKRRSFFLSYFVRLVFEMRKWAKSRMRVSSFPKGSRQ